MTTEKECRPYISENTAGPHSFSLPLWDIFFMPWRRFYSPHSPYISYFMEKFVIPYIYQKYLHLLVDFAVFYVMLMVT